MAKQQISTCETSCTLRTLERLFFRVRSFMSLEMFQAGERPSARLAHVRPWLIRLGRWECGLYSAIGIGCGRGGRGGGAIARFRDCGIDGQLAVHCAPCNAASEVCDKVPTYRSSEQDSRRSRSIPASHSPALVSRHPLRACSNLLTVSNSKVQPAASSSDAIFPQAAVVERTMVVSSLVCRKWCQAGSRSRKQWDGR